MDGLVCKYSKFKMNSAGLVTNAVQSKIVLCDRIFASAVRHVQDCSVHTAVLQSF